MGVFLLFDDTRRLVRTSSAAGRYGQNDPMSIFFKKGDPDRLCFEALEINPEILRQIRPAAFEAIQLHSKLARGGILVDELEQIRARILAQNLHSGEWEVFQIARDLLISKATLEELGVRMEAPENYVKTRQQELDRAKQRLHDTREGVILTEVPEVLVDLSGRLFPI